MDANTFIKERERMCKTCSSCFLCPAWLDGCTVGVRSGFTPEQQINIVKAWVEQHPRKTRQSVFLEQYPNAKIDSNGILYLCPSAIYGADACDRNSETYLLCNTCRRKFWAKEVE